MRVRTQEDMVDSAFSKKSHSYEDYGRINQIVRWSREQVYSHLSRFMAAKSRVLELNGGTGEDALYLARQGHDIHVIDIADGMVAKIMEKTAIEVPGSISCQKLSYLNLHDLDQTGFDYIFSNFGGLNLTPNLKPVFSQFSDLLIPGGFVTLVMLSRFSLWELLTLFWSRSTAYRRIPSLFGYPVPSRVAGDDVLTFYFSRDSVIDAMPTGFELISVQGLCTLVPPSYYETFPCRYPRLFELLKNLESRLSWYDPLSRIGDFYIVTFRYIPGADEHGTNP